MSFAEHGYSIVRGAIDTAALARFRAEAERLLEVVPPEEQRARRSTGSLVTLWASPIFAELMGAPSLVGAVRDLGYAQPVISNAYIVSKPASSPRTFWHQDWWGWNDPQSYGAYVHQVGCLMYCTDTDRDNGCLRVIPGSHRKRHAMHIDVHTEHLQALRRYDNPSATEFAEADGEVDVAVRAGDIVMLDARLLHATHANITSERRTAILVWFIPELATWSDELRRRNPVHALPDDWPAAARDKVAPLLSREGIRAAHPEWFGLNPGPSLR